MLAFKYWADLEGLECGEILQHGEMVPFYFGCVAVLNGLFENNTGRWNACKMAFDSIPKEKVQSLYDKMDEFKVCAYCFVVECACRRCHDVTGSATHFEVQKSFFFIFQHFIFRTIPMRRIRGI